MASFAGRSHNLFDRVERKDIGDMMRYSNKLLSRYTRKVSLRGNGDVIEEQFAASVELRRGLNKFRSYHRLPHVTLKESCLPHARSVQVSVIPFL